MIYSGWLRHNFPTGAVEGDTYRCLSTREVFTYKNGVWELEASPAKTPPVQAPTPATTEEKPKKKTKKTKKKAE